MDDIETSLVDIEHCDINVNSINPGIGWPHASEDSLSNARRASLLGNDSGSEDCTTKSDFSVNELSDDCISDIMGFECGEPLKPQHLRIDFNPLEGIDDNEYVLNKCMAFWKMIEENPSIQHLKVLPEIVDDVHSFQNSASTDINSRQAFAPNEELSPILDCVEIIEKDAKKINDIFSTKFTKKYCDDGSGDYSVGNTKLDQIKIPKIPEEELLKASRKGGSSRTKQYWQNEGEPTKQRSNTKRSSLKKQQARQREEFAKLYQELEEWDSKHPKIMDPPAHPPNLCHAVLQRN